MRGKRRPASEEEEEEEEDDDEYVPEEEDEEQQQPKGKKKAQASPSPGGATRDATPTKKKNANPSPAPPPPPPPPTAADQYARSALAAAGQLAQVQAMGGGCGLAGMLAAGAVVHVQLPDGRGREHYPHEVRCLRSLAELELSGPGLSR